ncbi:MAG: hypothetical protein B7Z52_04405, partial [Burkholderiales bacterium 12-64-5]
MASVEALTPAEWQFRLDRERVPSAASDDAPFADLRRQFRELTLRTRAVHRSDWLQQPTSGTVHRRLQSSLLLSQLLAGEFQRQDHADPTTIAELLVATDRLLTELEQQFLLSDLVHEAAEQLHPLVDQIVFGGEQSGRRLFNFVDELTASIQTHRRELAAVPLDATQLQESLETFGWSRGEWFSQALLTA